MGQNTRLLAARTLDAVIIRGKSLDAALAQTLETVADRRDRSFVQELVYGVLRWYWRLESQLGQLLRKPLRERDRDIELLLLTGLYQLEHLSTPGHAAVSETVAACGELHKPWARGLVNGVLRNALRRSAELEEICAASTSGRTSHPEWLVRALLADWRDDAENLMAANNERPPLTLRVNERRTSRDAYLARLGQAGIGATPTRYSPCGIRLDEPVATESLPGFDAGDVSVQDEAAQLAEWVLQVPVSGRVLDACAAPGGKAAHVLERNAVELVALDHAPARVERMNATFARLGLDAKTVCADATEITAWWNGEMFDRVLIDAPCSGTGVIRRHPDIKHHRRPADIGEFARRQNRLLDSLWPLLRPGGKLVYATCSVLRAENDAVVEPFIARTPDAVPEPIAAPWGTVTNCGRQILTGSDDMDGFYYARIAHAEAGQQA